MIERRAITDEDEWHAWRRNDVTASVVSALLGANDYVSPYGLYLLKAGLISEDPEETPPMRRGRKLEPVAVGLLHEERPDWRVEQPRAYYRDPDIRLGATPDVLAVDHAEHLGVVQIKSVEASVFRKKWIGSDDLITPPLAHVIQAITEAHLAGAEWAAVAALVVGFGIDLHVVPVPIHDGIIDKIKAEVVAFWDRIARRDPYPPDYARDGALIAAQFERCNGETVDLRGKDNALPILAAEDARLAAEIKAAKDCRDTIRAEILAKIGAAEIVLFDGGRLTAPTVSRKAYTVKAGKPYRDLRIKVFETTEAST
jgi:predicted phage-related endonuclease